MRRSPLAFITLVFALSVPFWLLAALTDLELLPGLPVSALMLVCPGIAAAILVHRETGVRGVRARARELRQRGRRRERLDGIRRRSDPRADERAQRRARSGRRVGGVASRSARARSQTARVDGVVGVTSAIVACLAVIVTVVWGPRTLARFSADRKHAAVP